MNKEDIKSFKKMNRFEKTKFMFGWKRPPMPFLVKLTFFLSFLVIITFPLLFIDDGKYELTPMIIFSSLLFVGYFAKLDDYTSMVEKAFEKEFGMTQEEFFYEGADNSSIPIYQPEDLDSNPELKKIFTPKIIVINPIGSITNGKNYEVHFRIKELLSLYKHSYSFKFIASSVNDFNNLKSLIVDEMGFDFQVVQSDKQYDFLSKEYGLNNFYYISSSLLDKNIKQDCYCFYNPERIHQSEKFAEGYDIGRDHTLETILRFIDNNESYSTYDALYRPD